MKKFIKLLALVFAIAMISCCIVACNGSGAVEEITTTPNTQTNEEVLEWVDYVSNVKLDMNSSTLKQDVTVKQYIDGDTTHFNVPSSVMPLGIFKARYLAINTPESTGQIEEWGKAASNFTKNALSNAVSIIIESDSNKWNADSTGDRYLVWVWYKTAEDAEYRNLNIEILQNGLAIASNSSQNRYGTTCMDAIKQAEAHKLYVYSKEKDPDFYYGAAIELTLKELRANADKYVGKDVAFEGVVTKNDGTSVYVENFDDETGMYHGMSIYYGYNLNGIGMSVLSVGNKVRIVGSMQYYEAGSSYQVADIKYDMLDPTSPDSISKISSGHSGAYVLTSPQTFVDGKVSITVINENDEEEIKEFNYAEMALSTTISMNDLQVTNVYTTSNGGSSDGAMTLTCTSGDYTIDVRTNVLKDSNGNVVTEEFLIGKTIDVSGIVDCYDGDYQIKVLSFKDITIH